VHNFYFCTSQYKNGQTKEKIKMSTNPYNFDCIVRLSLGCFRVSINKKNQTKTKTKKLQKCGGDRVVAASIHFLFPVPSSHCSTSTFA